MAHPSPRGAFVGVLNLRTRACSTLFAWILAEAPRAELDAGSRRTVEALQSKGSLS